MRQAVTSVALAAVVFLSLAGLSPAGAGAAGPAAGGGTSAHLVPASNLSVSVTWNGVSVDYAGTATTAFAINPGETAVVTFSWNQSGGTPITNATLILRFLGETLSSESERATPVNGSGRAQMNWSFGSLYELTEGVYELDALLLDANGNTDFAQVFYVDAVAPLGIVSAIPLFALVLGGVEVYWIASSIIYRRRRRGRYRFR